MAQSVVIERSPQLDICVPHSIVDDKSNLLEYDTELIVVSILTSRRSLSPFLSSGFSWEEETEDSSDTLISIYLIIRRHNADERNVKK